jgi:hypothetical protein
MPDNKQVEEHPFSGPWPLLDPKIKKAVRRSLEEWMAQEYPSPAEIPAGLRDLLSRMDERET